MNTAHFKFHNKLKLLNLLRTGNNTIKRYHDFFSLKNASLGD